jgi:hypothetical protein
MFRDKDSNQEETVAGFVSRCCCCVLRLFISLFFRPPFLRAAGLAFCSGHFLDSGRSQLGQSMRPVQKEYLQEKMAIFYPPDQEVMAPRTIGP